MNAPLTNAAAQQSAVLPVQWQALSPQHIPVSFAALPLAFFADLQGANVSSALPGILRLWAFA